jgi:hypothetical protein
MGQLRPPRLNFQSFDSLSFSDVLLAFKRFDSPTTLAISA